MKLYLRILFTLLFAFTASNSVFADDLRVDLPKAITCSATEGMMGMSSLLKTELTRYTVQLSELDDPSDLIIIKSHSRSRLGPTNQQRCS